MENPAPKPLFELFGHFRTDERVDENRSVFRYFPDETERFAAQRVQPFRRHVESNARAADDRVHGNRNQYERDNPQRMMRPHGIPVRFPRPVPAFNHQDVEVDRKARQRNEFSR